MLEVYISNILKEEYQLEGNLTPLAGELDLNFKCTSTDGAIFIVKIAHQSASTSEIAFQEALLLYLEKQQLSFKYPRLIKNKDGQYHSILSTRTEQRILRVMSWVDGRLWAAVNPKLEVLREGLGSHCGHITRALEGFTHHYATRVLQWDIAQGLWIKDYVTVFNKAQLALISPFIKAFEKQELTYKELPKGVVHNDANDYNIIVSEALVNPKVIGIIDYGDACYTQIINDLAIACTYGIMHTEDPLQAALPIVASYHKAYELTEASLGHLHTAIGMRLSISLTKAAINKKEAPENTYLFVSETPAWDLLKKWTTITPNFAYYAFRKACNFSAHPKLGAFKKWAIKEKVSLKSIFPNQNKTAVHHLDLSVESLWVEHQAAFNNLDYFEYKIQNLQKEHPQKLIAGGYLEPRPLYTSEDYVKASNQGPISRCIHMGIDFWLPEQTSVHSLFDGKIIISLDRKGTKEYGGFVVLEHIEDGLVFYSLYGHLSPASIMAHKVGNTLLKGARIGLLGNARNNGNWAPHLHFQLMLDLLGYQDDFPGVQTFQQQAIWADICPDPNLLFKVSALERPKKLTNKTLLDYREAHLGKSLSLQYQTPIQIVRGEGVYLIDQNGQKYLDTVNNVAHVGHEHPRLIAAGQKQMAVLNTNTRYLHSNINKAAAAILETLPPSLSVVHFVNSGSEANELALRMAYVCSGSMQIIASEHGYHGNTNSTIGVSSYKFDGKGGQGKPEHTHLIPIPNVFRGKFRGSESGTQYSKALSNTIKALESNGQNLAGFIIEPIISCGGQVPLADGFLGEAYRLVRAAGGLCISDEVQTGCGRMGSHFWGFEWHGVIPDIVTIGKPLGNGHPVAAVVCTQEVAQKFANGMEFFNTFGGNPVSCAIALETLRVVKDEKLKENALEVGNFLKEGLQKLMSKHPIIRDVRGHGLFLGIEFLTVSMIPLAAEASYVANRMKDYGILMSTDGPDHNVLKIKPPMVFSIKNAERLLNTLDIVLGEDFINAVYD
jgi:4-aminobutyrate aminotransferase-like enzyme/Ser/Thr protein kinase RdoA (MazF antagonist)